MLITEDQINQVVKRIVETAKPEKVILFGSYAYGTPNEGSDLDILVIQKSDLPNRKCSSIIRQAMDGLKLPMDIIVYKPEQVDYWKDTPVAFVTHIINKGKLLYE